MGWWFFWLVSSASAFDTIGSAWPASDLPIPYWIAADLGSLEDAAAVLRIQAAVDAWASAPCGVPFAYQGRLEGTSFGEAADSQNVIYMVEAGWPEESALVSAPRPIVAGTEIREVDIALNGQYFSWVLTGADGLNLLDVQGGVTHEVGHLLGLWHSTVTGATLNPMMAGNPEAQSLEADDLEGLCFLYEGIAIGGGELGDTCVSNEDCGDDLSCLVDGDTRYCSSTCTGDAACPEGYLCLDVGAGGKYCALEGDAGGGGGCSATAPPAGPWRWLWLGLLGLWWRTVAPRRGRPAGESIV